MRVRLMQARLFWKDPGENRARLEEQLSAIREGFDLAIFPETFTTGFLGDPDLPTEGMDGPTVAWMRELAGRHGAAIAGSAVIVEKGRRYNRFLLVAEDGEVQHYDKRHLFGVGGENERYEAGTKRVVLRLGEWRICPQICYDLRFPAWCRNRDDYDLLLFVANWPGGRIEHWKTLLQARAIENQSWVIGLNRVGEDGLGVSYPGCSQVYDPLGKLVTDLGGTEATHQLELELDQVRATRVKFPFLADADRFELTPG